MRWQRECVNDPLADIRKPVAIGVVQCRVLDQGHGRFLRRIRRRVVGEIVVENIIGKHERNRIAQLTGEVVRH